MKKMIAICVVVLILLSTSLYIFNFYYAPKIITYSHGLNNYSEKLLTESTISEYSPLSKVGLLETNWKFDDFSKKGFGEYRIDVVKMLLINIVIVLSYAALCITGLVPNSRKDHTRTIVFSIAISSFMLISTINMLINAYSEEQFQTNMFRKMSLLQQEAVKDSDILRLSDQLNKIQDTMPDISLMESQISEIYDRVFGQ